jgi:pimeloyl-ACP methyl ester carboxylesterase
VRRSLLFTVVFAGLTGLSGPAHASHIYLLRGLANIFSTGLDVLNQELIDRGYKNTSIHNYSECEDLAEEAAQLEQKGKGPIIIIGHSLGANSAIYMAEKMAEYDAPVRLIVSFGPSVYDLQAPANVDEVLNYYTGNRGIIHKGEGFTGTLNNVDMDDAPGVNHLNIEKNEGLHAYVISKIETVLGRPTAGGSAAAH